MEPNSNVKTAISSVVTEVEILATAMAKGDVKNLPGTALERAVITFAREILEQATRRTANE